MRIKVRCDCGKTLVASDQLAGKKTKCPACGALLRLPRLDDGAEQPASFHVTETGLNLTSDSQEGFAVPADEMPHPFNFSLTEQEDPVDLRRVEEPVVDQHGSAASPAGCPPVYGRLVGEPLRVQCDSAMRMLGRVVGRIPTFQFAMQVERETAIRIVAAIGLGTWLFTLGSPPSAWVLVHYLGLAAVVVSITLEIVRRVSRLKPFGGIIAVVAVLGAWWYWPQFDCYDERWVSDTGTTYTDRWTRSGRHCHRTLQKDTEKQSDGSFIYGNRVEGPMAGDPPKPHGHWERFEFKSYSTTHMWFWYGDSITQGEWELRNK